jgi:hypothetical protein
MHSNPTQKTKPNQNKTKSKKKKNPSLSSFLKENNMKKGNNNNK